MRCVITGTSRGIGAGLAAAYKARGDDVVATTRNGEWPLDVADADSQAAFAQSLHGQPIDLLVCNAGVYLDKGHDLQNGFGAQLWADTFAANVGGVFQTIQSLLPNLRAAENSKIAIISSQMGSSERAGGGSYIYRASKAAALNLGRNLSVDLQPDGIAVGIYHPGWVITDMGGGSADITVEQAVDGLVSRFDELGMATTGIFQTWDGRDMPF